MSVCHTRSDIQSQPAGGNHRHANCAIKFSAANAVFTDKIPNFAKEMTI